MKGLKKRILWASWSKKNILHKRNAVSSDLGQHFLPGTSIWVTHVRFSRKETWAKDFMAVRTDLQIEKAVIKMRELEERCLHEPFQKSLVEWDSEKQNADENAVSIENSHQYQIHCFFLNWEYRSYREGRPGKRYSAVLLWWANTRHTPGTQE